MSDFIADFARESNRIEGIHRDPTTDEIGVTAWFIYEMNPSVDALEQFVRICAPGHVLRRKAGLDVRVGSHIAPPGGMHIEGALGHLIFRAINNENLWRVHCDYETLHPFTDGNGRSGRVLWAWMMQRQHGGFPLGFLHHFYYQTLENLDGRT